MENFFKVGRLRRPVAKSIGVRCADIYIDSAHIDHIDHVHRKELRQLGVTALPYVRMIARDYNMVLQGSGESLLLAIHGGEVGHVAAIDLNYSTKKGFWEVKTAQPRRYSEIARKKLLWRACPRPR